MRRLLLALSFVAVAGCGGGGGHKSSPEEAPLFTRTATLDSSGGEIVGPVGSSVRVSLSSGTLVSSTDVTVYGYSESHLKIPNTAANRVSGVVNVSLDDSAMTDGASLQVQIPASKSVPGDEGYGIVTDGKGHVLPIPTAYDAGTRIFTLQVPKVALSTLQVHARSAIGAVKSLGYTVIGRDLYAEEGRADLKRYSLGIWSPYASGSDHWTNKRVALILHGMRNRLEDMGDLAEYLASLKGQDKRTNYDEVWGFDYGWSDNIANNGVRLAKVLQEVAPNATQVDVFGHSMGGLVSRWAIEKEGAGSYVTRLITLGTPNLGVPQGALTALVFSAGSLAGGAAYLNGLTWTPGILDLRSDSQFMRELNDGNTPPSAIGVRYIVLAGNDSDYLPSLAQRTIDDFYKAYAGAPAYDGIVPVDSGLASGLDRKALSVTRLPLYHINHTNMRGQLTGNGPFSSKNLTLDNGDEHLFRNQILSVGGGDVSIQ